jgi:hypothetical protein
MYLTYLKVGSPKADNPCVLSKVLLLCLFWFAKRSRISDVAKVLV